MNNRLIRQNDSIGVSINNIPAAFLSIPRHMAICYILKNLLMEITDIIIIRFIPLTKNFITYSFFPCCSIYGFVKNQLNRVNNVAIKSF